MISRRAAFAAALLALSGPAVSQTTGTSGSWESPDPIVAAWQRNPQPRAGKVDQAIADTIFAWHTRNNGPFGPDSVEAAKVGVTIGDVMRELRADAEYYKNCFTQGGIIGWHQSIRCAAEIAFPFLVGRGKSRYIPPEFAGAGGTTGGGGAHVNGWRSVCDDWEYTLDAEGFLIIPSAPLMPGVKGVGYTGGAQPQDKDRYYANTHLAFNGYASPKAMSDNVEAVVKWQLHKINSALPKADWYGIHNKTWKHYDGGAQSEVCLALSTIAYRRTDNSLVPRKYADVCVQKRSLFNDVDERSIYPHDVEHKPCPVDGSASGSFHFYGDNPKEGLHWDTCTWYAPNPDLGQDGYAINKGATDAVHLFPHRAPEHLKGCPINMDLIRKLTQAYLNKVAKKPGYTGVPVPPEKPVKTEDVCPGDTAVVDLATAPGATTPTPNTNCPQAPPDTNDPPADPDDPDDPDEPGGTPECMFGPDGCKDPTPGGEPVVGSPPTGMMDGLFDWLPDLPSISLNTAGAACPTWAVDASSFGGADWAWTLESHCDLLEAHREAIGALFIVFFGFAAAVIILRA